jgi:hypothetical protein
MVSPSKAANSSTLKHAWKLDSDIRKYFACLVYDALCSVALLSSTSLGRPLPRMNLTLHSATAEGRRHSAAVREPGPIQEPEKDRLGKGGHVMKEMKRGVRHDGYMRGFECYRVSGAGGSCNGL